MLDVLLDFDYFIDPLEFSQAEYWTRAIEQFDNQALDLIFNLNATSNLPGTDDYWKLIKSYRTDKGMIEIINTLIEKKTEIVDGFDEDFMDVGVKVLDLFPYFLLEILKICSRLYNYPFSNECSAIREIVLKDKTYNSNSFVNHMFLKGEESMSEYRRGSIFKNFDHFLSTIHDNCSSLTGTISAAINESILIDVNRTYSSTCRLCASACNISKTEHSEFFVTGIVTDATRELVYSVGLSFSVGFLTATLIVFAMLPRLRRNIHGKCTTFHLTSMNTSYFCLACVQHAELDDLQCYVIGHVMQYGFLAMFFWLNVMCFDILLAFCFLKDRKSMMRKERRAERSKLFWYCCYGWGGPLIILMITLVLEYTDIMDPESYHKPDIGGPKCFFQNKETQWLFLYGPIGCLILANLIMFSITAVKIYCHSKNTDLIQRSSDNSTSNKGDNNRLKVYINLFILMGVNWAAEALSWVLPRSEWFSYLTDVTTTLQGVVVFILFVCKARVIRDLRIKMGFRSSQSSTQASGNRQTTISSNASKSSGKDLASTPLKSLDEK